MDVIVVSRSSCSVPSRHCFHQKETRLPLENFSASLRVSIFFFTRSQTFTKCLQLCEIIFNLQSRIGVYIDFAVSLTINSVLVTKK